MSEITFYLTTRGKDLLLYQTYLFKYAYNNNTTNVTVWYCIKCGTHSCKCKLFLVNGNCVRLEGYHSHENEMKRIICFEFQRKLSIQIDRKDEALISEMYREFMVEYQKSTQEGFQMPDFESIKHILYNKRFWLQLTTPEKRKVMTFSDPESSTSRSDSCGETSPKRKKKSKESLPGTNPAQWPQSINLAPHERRSSSNCSDSSASTVILETTESSDSHAVSNSGLQPTDEDLGTSESNVQSVGFPSCDSLSSSSGEQQESAISQESMPSQNFTVFKPYCSTVNETSGVESLVITDLRTIATPDLQTIPTPELQTIPTPELQTIPTPDLQTIPLPSQLNPSGFDYSPENKTETELTSRPIKQERKAIDASAGSLDLNKQQMENPGSSNLSSTQKQSDLSTEYVNVVDEIEDSTISSIDTSASTRESVSCDGNIQSMNNNMTYTSMTQPQQGHYSLLTSNSAHKYSPLSAIDQTCKAITNPFHQRLPSSAGSYPYQGMLGFFNNIAQSRNITHFPYMFHNHQRMSSTPIHYPIHSIGPINSSADRTFELSHATTSHIESKTASTACPITIQSSQAGNGVSMLNKPYSSTSSVMLNNPESLVTNYAPNNAFHSTIDGTCVTNKTHSNQQDVYLNPTGSSCPSSASSGIIHQNKISQNFPSRYGHPYSHFPLPNMNSVNQNGPIGPEAYPPGNRIPKYPDYRMKNSDNSESSEHSQRKNQRISDSPKRENLQAGPIIVNAFAAKEISSPGLVRPKDKFDMYAEYFAEELRTKDPRTRAHIQKVVSDLLFEAETKNHVM